LVGEKYADSSAGALSPVCFGLRRDRWRCGSDACAHHNGLYTVYDREYYLAPDAIQFVRPGLNISIQSAQIGSDGTISTDFQIITDVPPAGSAPQLDITGVNTPGPISVSFLIAYIPSGQLN
jgi:hypothetical protein